ncbi:MAG: hypothetical protein OEZ36_06900 [Spirochaetota bacterium]|nr:hypothetical protein [Spirochaetota bacterium]
MIRRTGLALIIVAVILSALSGYSAMTRFLGDSSIRDFQRGKLVNMSIDRNGYLMLSPKMKEIYASNETLYVWCVAEDSKGNIYFGTGDKPRIYQISPSGKLELYYESETGVSISSLAIDKKDNLYASVNPGAEIIKIGVTDTVKTVADLKEKYVWAMKHDSKDNLYIATGNKATIYKISPSGTAKLAYSSKDESHFLSLDIDLKDNVYFGSAGKGILYKLTDKTDSARVLYDSYENEIKDIVTDNKGNIYFATATKSSGYPPSTFDYTDSFVLYGAAKKLGIRSKKAPHKNSIYKVSADGGVKKLFTRDNTLFLSLTLDKNNHLYAGSGNDGVIYKITDVNKATIYLNSQELQVLDLHIKKNGSLLAATGNVGKVLSVLSQKPADGHYLSRVFNASGKAVWGKISWDAHKSESGKLLLHTRTGNSAIPDNTWTAWSSPYNNSEGELISSKPGNYIQYKAIFKAGGQSPVIKSVNISYLLENRPPQIEKVRLKHDKNKNIEHIGPYSQFLPPSVYTLSWESSDRDYDFLSYSIYFREEKSSNWILLEKDIYSKKFSFDSRRLPDGNYFFKVQATDEKSNGKNRAKTGSDTSISYKMDNSPPAISNTSVKKTNTAYIVQGVASDRQSFIKIIQYSLNSQNWVYLGPKDLIFDSKKEQFEITINKSEKTLRPGKNIIIFRVADAYNNVSTFEVPFEVK